MGSSSSRMSGSWASAIAIQTRWRCPPDSSSTRRSASSSVPVGREGLRDDPVVGGDHWPHRPWCGWRPRPARSATVIPSGAIGAAGAAGRATRATSRVARRWMSRPSSGTAPACGRKMRAIAAQQRRLAARVGADDGGHPAPSGTERSRSWTTGAARRTPGAGPRASSWGAARREPVTRRPASGRTRPAATGGRARRSRRSRPRPAPGRPRAAGAGRRSRRPTRRSTPTSAAGTSSSPPVPTRRRAIGARHERHERDRPRGGRRHGGERDRRDEQRQPGPLDGHAEARRRVVAELEGPQRRRARAAPGPARPGRPRRSAPRPSSRCRGCRRARPGRSGARWTSLRVQQVAEHRVGHDATRRR